MIGIFDSGLGGLSIQRAIFRNKFLARYSYLYLGDNLRSPYGSRSQRAIFNFSLEAVNYLFSKGCWLVIIACNTSSALALRKIQRKWLKKNYPQRRVLGVIRPTIERIFEGSPNVSRVGILATKGTVNSYAYIKEIKKIKRGVKVYQSPAPLLVPLIEEGKVNSSCLREVLREYLAPLIKKRIEVLVLACTHYSLIKRQARSLLPKKVKILSQDEIIPEKLTDYLKRHPEIERKIAKQGKRIFLATDISFGMRESVKKFFKKEIKIRLIDLERS